MSTDVVVLRCELRQSDRQCVRSLCEATQFFTADETDVAVELVDERLARGVASGYWFVFAEVAGKVIGYACYGPIACTRGSFDLYWVVVDPACQGRGVGRQLVAAVEQQVSETHGRQLYIETSSRDQYTPTRQFYSRLGYQQVACMADFYDVGDDKIVFAKTLVRA
jgi:GNAT superfamily N-acetyltransferase